MIMLDEIQKGSIEIFGHKLTKLKPIHRNYIKRNWGVFVSIWGTIFLIKCY